MPKYQITIECSYKMLLSIKAFLEFKIPFKSMIIEELKLIKGWKSKD